MKFYSLVIGVSCFLLSSIALADNCPNVSDLKQIGSNIQATTPGGIMLTYNNSSGWINFDPTKIIFSGAAVKFQAGPGPGVACTYYNQEQQRGFSIANNTVLATPEGTDWIYDRFHDLGICKGSNPEAQCNFSQDE